jgi:hypothetical protein
MSQIAEFARAHFARQFQTALITVDGADLAFERCFRSDHLLDGQAAREAAHAEWDAWVHGAYPLCLRIFTAETCVRKESLAAMLRRHLSDPKKYSLSKMELLHRCEALAQLILPFAPWKRANSPPGQTIDRFLKAQGLGVELPYPCTWR